MGAACSNHPVSFTCSDGHNKCSHCTTYEEHLVEPPVVIVSRKDNLVEFRKDVGENVPTETEDELERQVVSEDEWRIISTTMQHFFGVAPTSKDSDLDCGSVVQSAHKQARE